EAGTAAQRQFFAPMREDQLQPLQMQARFFAVPRERFLQFRRAGSLCEAWQRANHLCFRVVEIAEVVEVEVFQRCDAHAPHSWPRLEIEGSHARPVPRKKAEVQWAP